MFKCVWALESEEILEYLYEIQHNDAMGWLAVMLKTLKQDDLIRVLVTMWAIWHARRQATHENSFQNLFSTHCFVNHFVHDLELSEEKP